MHTGKERRHRGQAIVVFTLALVAAVAMVGLVIDGGNAYAQQRGTQNAADAAAETGATAIGRSLLAAAVGTSTSSTQLDADVLAAMNASAQDNRIRPFTTGTAGNSRAYYTDIEGNLLTGTGDTTTDPASAVQVGSGSVPPCNNEATCIGGRAVGVMAVGERQFNTYVAGAVGLATLNATTQATAVTGYAPPSDCTAAEGCALLPVTFATHPATCDGRGKAVFDLAKWDFLRPGYPSPDRSAANELILSLCKDGAGAWGWLDFGCGNTASQIENPCNVSISFPTWLQAQPGNPNNVEDELNAYAGDVVGTYEPAPPKPDQVVQIPFFDAICNARNQPADNTPIDTSGGFPGICEGDSPGGGNNTWFHVTYFLGFILDHAYVQGNDFPACNQVPGQPPSGGNGSNGCFKGWASVVTPPPGPVTVNPGPGVPGFTFRVQLIR